MFNLLIIRNKKHSVQRMENSIILSKSNTNKFQCAITPQPVFSTKFCLHYRFQNFNILGYIDLKKQF